MPIGALINYISGYEAKRKRLLKKAPEGPLKDFLSTPFPSLETPIHELGILAVDFETTGLDAKKDKLLSIGFVAMEQEQIKLNSCYHQIINTTTRLKESNVIIHQITDDQKEQGQPLELVVKKLLTALTGKVMLVHFARIERQFLQQACLELYGLAPDFPIIDTLVIAKRKLDKRDVSYDPSELRLSNLRQKYQLPDHHGHNALNDAIATAELLLAQINDNSKNATVQLKDILL
ncbi:exonuclease domain-containing protein [Colwellia sp. 1_MG-2023]|jgi:DNA polymerase-3 subunit epsilon|uniref:exonuclease domain-containing protein n=1 Tax=unclassified Colwellia TaxID=196834 RepID=UPI001C098637|nr:MULTISPECIES: exonuclease domain-containing protein [unclassified Colwellia]MBU2923671.1 DNA polymerase III subunit epsilon [Colwellia sp. C2M11]MDO6486238.1 exonuclease domain-containing protein [Colwellia sp. 6_MG-2023]MDO6652229.1 exonuclease domain-containing protein [Colwellia sp. 3_MG-2023]MDO6664602.1 exonuclease domain-containing protein [Colwellia sp. 2_MG-2023]MDO6688953.1 exonuclease domain-containing protein [Colwellia sp. 1_MG-2023]